MSPVDIALRSEFKLPETMTEPRRFPPPWTVEEYRGVSYIVRDANNFAVSGSPLIDADGNGPAVDRALGTFAPGEAYRLEASPLLRPPVLILKRGGGCGCRAVFSVSELAFRPVLPAFFAVKKLSHDRSLRCTASMGGCRSYSGYRFRLWTTWIFPSVSASAMLICRW